MNSKKVHQLVRNIRDLKYPEKSLKDVEIFEKTISSDLGIDIQEAMALLGYLLARDYVRIIPGMGLVVNPENTDLQELIKSGVLDRE